MNKITNRQVMCESLIAAVQNDSDICVLTSDSRGSASLTKFIELYPHNSIETGIAEQNIVSISAGLAHSGKRPFVASPACFLSMRSIEQVKVDVAYSNTNVKLIGISGGVSYGALGMSHHSTQDFAVMRAIPNLELICPADRFETEAVFEYLVKSNNPAYVRLGRNAVADVYKQKPVFEPGKVNELITGQQVMILATGETVQIAMEAATVLKNSGKTPTVVNCSSIKPFDSKYLIEKLKDYNLLITLEEHSIYGGLGSAAAEVIATNDISIRQVLLGIKDYPSICGTPTEIFADNGLTVANVLGIIRDFYASKK